MIPANLTLAWRNIKRYKTPYLISISGLFLATVAIFLISRYVLYHFSMDGFHQDADRIIRVNTLINMPNQSTKYAASAFALGPDMIDQYPEFSHLVRIRSMPATLDFQEIRFDEGMVTFVDSSFLDVFTFAMIDGDASTALKRPDAIVITQEIADKYFANSNPLGSVLRINVANQEKDLTVTGVLENPPANSTIRFSMLGHIDQIAHTFRPGYASLIPGLFTYFKLSPNISDIQINNNFIDFVKHKVPEQLQPVMSFHGAHLRDIYFETDYQFDWGEKGNKKTLYSLMALGILTLLIAIVNYINISTALGIKRSREMAVRKILGSSPWQITKQHLNETFAIVTLIVILASIFGQILQGRLDQWVDRELSTGYFHGLNLLGFGLISIAIIGLLAGAYPAFVIARMPIVEVLKRKLKFFQNSYDFKKVLLGFQFTISIFFLISAWIVFDQLNYLRTKDPGFNRENVILVEVAGPQNERNISSVKENLLQVAGVKDITVSTSSIYGVHTQANFSIPADSSGRTLLCDVNYVDEDFLKTYQANLLEGRDFSQEINRDIRQSIIINQEAATQLGLSLGKNTIGTTIQKIARDTTESKIIGVVADYHFQSMHQDIAPMFWQILPDAPKNSMAIRIQGDPQSILTDLQNAWIKLDLGETFEYTFLDQVMADAYRSEQQLGGFVRIMTLLMLFITCTGMYGMMLFIVEQKAGEIGIRKTLGASIAQIQIHLHKQYVWLMGGGFVIGGLLAYWAGQIWLEGFAYRISPTFIHFLGAGLLCCSMATFAIIWLTRRAASLNPVEVLKNE